MKPSSGGCGNRFDADRKPSNVKVLDISRTYQEIPNFTFNVTNKKCIFKQALVRCVSKFIKNTVLGVIDVVCHKREGVVLHKPGFPGLAGAREGPEGWAGGLCRRYLPGSSARALLRRTAGVFGVDAFVRFRRRFVHTLCADSLDIDLLRVGEN